MSASPALDQQIGGRETPPAGALIQVARLDKLPSLGEGRLRKNHGSGKLFVGLAGNSLLSCPFSNIISVESCS